MSPGFDFAMTVRKRSSLVSLLIAVTVTACGFVHDQKRIDGHYRLLAIDVEEQMDV
jgi:hypothetical protein